MRLFPGSNSDTLIYNPPVEQLIAVVFPALQKFIVVGHNGSLRFVGTLPVMRMVEKEGHITFNRFRFTREQRCHAASEFIAKNISTLASQPAEAPGCLV